jgi:hypothetical protein
MDVAYILGLAALAGPVIGVTTEYVRDTPCTLNVGRPI